MKRLLVALVLFAAICVAVVLIRRDVARYNVKLVEAARRAGKLPSEREFLERVFNAPMLEGGE